ncbi:MAG: UvrD-helicase domain-containing protein [Planctomycetes bacterium]|nr:UvrD-helicase domain-containing protein [Planctomycetota bacterium]
MEGTGQELLADLTPAQQAAVTQIDGPLLILAAAGSGKTRVITRRVAWLLQQGVRASNILAITFTNKSAGEMRQRVDALVPGNRVMIRTFHSLGANILRQYADRFELDRNFTIYDTDDRNKIVKSSLEAAGLDNSQFTPDRVGGTISKAKNQLITPVQYAKDAEDYYTQTVAKVYPIYQKKLRESNAMDFDDLLYLPALALRTNEELRADLDARFRYILIDEYQDTNQSQYEIARKLSVDYRNLCVVGDPDQSIYGWRGANIKNILDFERDFPDTRVVMLDKNYRSTKMILHAAGSLIEHNTQRKKKALITDNDTGIPVQILTFDTGLDEADQVVSRIKQAVAAKKHKYRDTAIFVRINALTRTLESAFVKYSVPFQIVKGLAFFERKENKDVLAYLRLLVNPRDDLSFMRSVNEPARGVGKTSLEHLRSFAESHELCLSDACEHVTSISAIKGKAATGLKAFLKLIKELRGLLEHAPEEIIKAVIEQTGYKEMLKSSNDPDDQDRLANVEELVTAARQFSVENPAASLGDFLEQITLASDVDAWDDQQDCVSVMTLHSSKGLEFPIVYVMAVEEGILPHERSLRDTKGDEKEEERRLLFVGMTRAMKELNLTHARLRDFRGQTLYAIPSGFLNELPEDAIEHHVVSRHAGRTIAHDTWRGGNDHADHAWEETGVNPSGPVVTSSARTTTDKADYFSGQIVQHDQYGIGQVTHINGFGALRKMKIRFVQHGEKTFIVDKVKLKAVPK